MTFIQRPFQHILKCIVLLVAPKPEVNIKTVLLLEQGKRVEN